MYFGVALAATADAIFHGRQATTADGFAVANERLGAIAGWAALAALVGTLISLLQQSGSLGEAIIGSLVGAAWSLITFLAIPVITFEGTGPWSTLKRSTNLFKERWAGQITGNVAIGGIAGLVLLVAILIGVGGVFLLAAGNAAADVFGAVLLVLAFVIGIASAVFAGATRGVFGVALYRYVAEEHAIGPFTTADSRARPRRADLVAVT